MVGSQKRRSGIKRISSILLLLISITVMGLGVLAFITSRAPAMHTKFGFMPGFYGPQAKEYGLVLMLMGCIPLIPFCKTSKQAVVVGTVIGLTLIVGIFAMAYA